MQHILTRRNLVIVVVIVVLYALAGFVAAPRLVRWYVPHYASQKLHCTARLEKVRINPFLLTVEIDGFSLKQADGSSLITFGRLVVDLQTSSLWHWAIVLRRVEIDAADVHVVVESDGSLNLARLAAPSTPKTQHPAAGPFPVIIEQAAIRNGQVSIVDKRQHRSEVFGLKKLDLHLQDISTLKDNNGTYTLSAVTDNRGSFRWQGELSLFPFQSKGRFDFHRIKASSLWKFFRDKSNLERPTGRINIATRYRLDAGKKPMQMTLDRFNGSISDLALRFKVAGFSSSQPRLTADTLTVAGGVFDLAGHSISVDRVALHGGRLAVRRGPDGKIDWLQLFRTNGEDDTANVAKTKVSPAWKYLVKSFTVNDFSSTFTDLTTRAQSPVVNLKDIQASFHNIDGTSPMDFTVGFQVDQGGQAMLKGSVNPSVPYVTADISATDITIGSLQPYLKPYVNLTLESASVSTHGKLSYNVPDAAQKMAYTGDFSLDDLSVNGPDSQKMLLGWQSLQVPHFRLTLQPDALEAQEIVIVKPSGEVTVEKDKTLNLTGLFKVRQSGGGPEAAGKAKKKEDRQPFVYSLSQVQIKNGQVVFADHSLHPGFHARIHEINGQITALSSERNARSKINLNGRVDQYGTAKINGTIRPRAFERFSSVDLDFRNLGLKNLSPYSGKFLGRLITSGRISANLKYSIKDYKMIGDNRIVINNLVLGKQIDEPGAANLPLDLAVALLTDANGRMNIGLPVTGDLRDPQFSFGPLVFKLFSDLITKVVTSPFLALGHMFGGDFHHFDMVSFDPGSPLLPPPEKEKLVRLAGALKQRPHLKLVIQGRYAPKSDRRAIRRLMVRHRIAAVLGEKTEAGEVLPTLDFTDSGIRKVLAKLYRKLGYTPSLEELEEHAAAGKKSVGPSSAEQYSEQAVLLAKELYSRLADHEKVTDQSLEQLARNRAQAVAVELEDKTHIPKNRITITGPVALQSDRRPSVKLILEAL